MLKSQSLCQSNMVIFYCNKSILGNNWAFYDKVQIWLSNITNNSSRHSNFEIRSCRNINLIYLVIGIWFQLQCFEQKFVGLILLFLNITLPYEWWRHCVPRHKRGRNARYDAHPFRWRLTTHWCGQKVMYGIANKHIIQQNKRVVNYHTVMMSIISFTHTFL